MDEGQQKSANEVLEQHGSFASDPRSGDLQYAHASLVARVDRIVNRLLLAGINVGEGLSATAAAAIDRVKTLAAPAPVAAAAPEPVAIDTAKQPEAEVVAKPTSKQLALLDDEEIWKEMDRRQAARAKQRIFGSSLAFGKDVTGLTPATGSKAQDTQSSQPAQTQQQGTAQTQQQGEATQETATTQPQGTQQGEADQTKAAGQ